MENKEGRVIKDSQQKNKFIGSRAHLSGLIHERGGKKEGKKKGRDPSKITEGAGCGALHSWFRGAGLVTIRPSRPRNPCLSIICLFPGRARHTSSGTESVPRPKPPRRRRPQEGRRAGGVESTTGTTEGSRRAFAGPAQAETALADANPLPFPPQFPWANAPQIHYREPRAPPLAPSR